ncbi:Oidioi.mRNA.OKI2018_I69.chr2.g4603.t1.cds [Oikopleura dioica]|uniref:Oidioi.mRNA.OKI2018_I69.chr2.g4603.t1.cds n=1 Tax=Oikopleura dioica TaxID=34765 RepID=A0ABN7SXK9_OIKDI|nr:Oidioi.mRNA.OKI2018_I69.chr2.g4603.t1.cds [Oikopleura dioica]
MRRLILFLSAVSARVAIEDEVCIDQDLQQDCIGICRVDYTACRLLCETEYCLSICSSNFDKCNNDCPCGENCPNGCECCENPICPTTESIQTTVSDDNGIFYPIIKGRGVSEAFLNGMYVLWPVDTLGDAVRIVEMEILEGGIKRGKIEDVKTNEQWRRISWLAQNGGNMMERVIDEGDFWRFVPHPTMPDTFQIHLDTDYHYDNNINDRNVLSILYNSFAMEDTIYAPRIFYEESVNMENEEYLWTFVRQ